jgi:hypothetical protein
MVLNSNFVGFDVKCFAENNFGKKTNDFLAITLKISSAVWFTLKM